MLTCSNLRITGRCLSDGGVLWLTFSLCEVAFTLTGASFLRLRLRQADPQNPAAVRALVSTARQKTAPRFAVDVGGARVLDTRLSQAEQVFDLPLPSGTQENDSAVCVRLRKLSECTQSILGLSDIETDGIVSPLPPQPLRLEFIGDSITCGYGVEATGPEETFSTATENAEKSYAGLIAGALDAAPMLTAFSGHGIVSGYTGDPAIRNGTELVPPYYETFGRLDFVLPSGRRLQDIPWPFDSFRPQAVILLLGTNDLSWCQQVPERHLLFRREYARFLRTVRSHNPDIPILCVLGLMGTALNGDMEAAVRDYTQATGDPAVRAFTVPEQDMVHCGAGADYHPSALTQRLFAQQLLSELRPLLNLESV